ncbi:Protein of unknown function DUF295 [Macleaya cordata]|uniref:KIB1-4 beta-propeller domain-containing protein n=1 Tax=Macleaya cordata TaxID=56857 RepID=A0A200PSU6_MACCD|nr:Protein of unknown function DUF295 [Macleaya cordata]
MGKKKLSAAERSERRRPPDPRASPWLVYPHGEGKKDQTFYNHCEPNNEKTYRKCLPEISGKSFWQSPADQGWLIVLYKDVEDDGQSSNFSSQWKLGDCFLWNPVSLETIQLPNLLPWINKNTKYHIRDSVLSSPPSNSDGNSMAFFLFAGDERPEYILLCCRPGVDKQWKAVAFPIGKGIVRGVFCFEGKLHISCYYDGHIEIDPFGNKKPVTVKWLNASHQPLYSVLGKSTPFVDHFVVSRDEIFRVVRIFHPLTVNKEIVTIEIFRMDFSLMSWVKVESLGDHVLFIGKCTTASCVAAEMGLTRGCVFFTQPNDKSLYTFDLEGDSISVVVPCPNLPTPWSSPDWVMMPTVTRVADGRRAEDILNDVEESIITEAMENKCSINVNEEEESQKTNGGELEESAWGILNEAILVWISSFLHPVDRIHFRSVCQAHRSAVPAVNWRTTSTDIIQTTSLSPWLVFSKKNDPIYNFIDPMHNNEKYHMNLSEFLLDAKIRFSKGGWLLMSSGKKTVFFFNPFTRERIQLPDLPGRYEYMFCGISFSSLPTSADCVVFAITEWGEDAVFIFFISRGDASWSFRIFNNTRMPSSEKCMEFVPWFNTPVFYNGGFYCLDYDGTLGVFDLEDNFSWKVLANPEQPCNSVYQSFLVECEGKLLSVFLGHIGSQVRIYRLDSSKMVWVKVKNLGKHMLCISHSSCISAIAPNSCMENKIYFSRFHGEGILFYSLDTGRYHSLGSQHSAQDFHNTKKQLNCSWIEPNWSRTTGQELDWLSI